MYPLRSAQSGWIICFNAHSEVQFVAGLRSVEGMNRVLFTVGSVAEHGIYILLLLFVLIFLLGGGGGRGICTLVNIFKKYLFISLICQKLSLMLPHAHLGVICRLPYHSFIACSSGQNQKLLSTRA